jgi:hypothetical protein
LASCTEFVTNMALLGYNVEPTGADSPDQNKGAEKWNDTLAVTIHVLLYGSGLLAEYWSAALVHAAFLHNRRVHKSTMMTPFQAWYGFKPDLQNLCVFGSRVCVKRTATAFYVTLVSFPPSTSPVFIQDLSMAGDVQVYPVFCPH